MVSRWIRCRGASSSTLFGGVRQRLLSLTWRILLVVVLVLAIIYPTLFRDASKGCMTQEEHISLAGFMYSNDYDDRFPLLNWTDSLRTYLRLTGKQEEPAQYYIDPAAPDEAYGYAMSREMVGRVLNNIGSPAETPAFFDSPLNRTDAVSSYLEMPNPPRHGDRNNIAFVDGHMRGVPPNMVKFLK